MTTHTGTFEPFAQIPEYRAVNAKIILDWFGLMCERGTRSFRRLLDVATGVGTMTELFLEYLPSTWRRPQVVCIDKSEEALQIARRHLSENGAVSFLCASAETLPLAASSADVVVWGNGIHYLSEEAQRAALTHIRRVLRPGGWFFFNTTFYDGARPPETHPFYRAQVTESVRILRERGVERSKSEGRPEASKYLSADHYRKFAEQVGFAVVEVVESAAKTLLPFWEAICGYREYSAGALHGYPPGEAASALQDGVRIAFNRYAMQDRDGASFIPRNWLSVGACKA